MRDRLKELKENLLQKSAVYQRQDDQDVLEEDMSPRRGSIVVYMDRRNTLTAVEDSFMVDFFHEVEDTREKINFIEQHSHEIRKLHSKILSTPTTEPSLQVELDDRMASIKALSKEIHNILKSMKKTMEEQEVQRWGTKTSNMSDTWTEAEFRIRRTQHAMLCKQFQEALNDFTNIKVEYREKHKEWLRRQMKIVSHDPTDTELEDIMEKGEANVFTDNVLMKTLEAKQALADVEARHEEILRIERSIRELRDLFLELAMQVEKQGEMIDNILYHAGQAAHHAEKAKRKIHQAKKLKSGIRKKKIIIFGLVIIVIIILGLIIYFTVVPVK